MLDRETMKDLYNKANLTRVASYSPYSNFSVGAVALCEGGECFLGVNIENASYSVGICAERVALSKAISEGKRPVAVAIAGGPSGGDAIPCPPCGICRQFMSEFMSADCPIIFSENDIVSLGELLPYKFDGDKLK